MRLTYYQENDMAKKPKTDPRLKIIEFVKPNGQVVRVNSFSASLIAATDLGWIPKKEVEATAAKKAAKAK